MKAALASLYLYATLFRDLSRLFFGRRPMTVTYHLDELDPPTVRTFRTPSERAEMMEWLGGSVREIVAAEVECDGGRP